jgi:transposase
VLATTTVTAGPGGYAQLVALAESHGGLRGWAMEGSGGYGAGLARHLHDRGELVVELDRPVRPVRRAGAKSDVIDAERAARDALSRVRLAAPKTGPQRASLQMLLTARRATVAAASEAAQQLRALVITAPEPVRARFRGQSTRAMLVTAARLRPHSHVGEVEVFTALSVLRALARRVTALETEAAEHEQAIRAIVRSWRPDLIELTGVGPINAASCWRPGPTPAAAAATPRSPCSPAPSRSPPARARPCATGSTAPGTDSSTAPCTTSP